MGRYNESIQACEKVIEIDPQYFVAWNNKGSALVYMSRYDESIQGYDKAPRINPNYAHAWNNKGATLRR